MSSAVSKGIYIISALTLVVISGCTAKTTVNTNPTSSPVVAATPAITESASSTPTPTASPSATPRITKAPTPKFSSQPLVNCVGPDGKTTKLSQKACDDFNKAWNKQTAAPTTAAQVNGCASYNPTGDVGSVRVNVTIESGQAWVGDAAVTFTRKYPECKGFDPGFPWTRVISSPGSQDFGAMRPGPYRAEVLYHGKTWSQDITTGPGMNNMTITVSNN